MARHYSTQEALDIIMHSDCEDGSSSSSVDSEADTEEASESTEDASEARARAILSSTFAFTKTHTLVSYIPRRGRNVLLLSTKHRSPDVSDEIKRKPVIIKDYNRCKGGVDNLDK
ncbi:hypothetical protein JOQ06_019049, partial [Pogonophryne albipinna]